MFLEAENGRSEAPGPPVGAAVSSGGQGAGTGLCHPGCGPHESQFTDGSEPHPRAGPAGTHCGPLSSSGFARGPGAYLVILS